VAEDNLINQKVISGLLADTGIELVMASDGQVALDILEQDSNFHFILMDAHMPRVDGFEATRQIRKNPAYNHIVIVALSGDTAADDIKKMSDAGMEEHLEKPLRMDSLYDILYTYSDEQSAEVESEFVLQELDAEQGLSICGDDDDFYEEILAQFRDTYADSASKLENMFQNAKMQEASKYLLDISGIAANIGANNIAQISQELRESIKNPKDSKYLNLFKKYTKSLHTLINEIDRYMK
jgi:CheY-like chemotaxis protein